MGDLKTESTQSHIIYHHLYIFHFRPDVEFAGWAVTIET